eukprot:sb/3475096/
MATEITYTSPFCYEDTSDTFVSCASQLKKCQEFLYIITNVQSDPDLPGCSGERALPGKSGCPFILPVNRGSGKSGPGISGSDCIFESPRPQWPVPRYSYTGKQPIIARYLGHVTGYQPIRDQYVTLSQAL